MNAEGMLALGAPLLLLAIAMAILRLSRFAEPIPAGIDASLYRSFRFTARICGSLSSATALVTLTGWFLAIPAWRIILPGGAPIKVNIALCLLLGGLAVLCEGADKETRWTVAARWCGALMAGISIATLAEYASGISLGIDEVLFTDPSFLSPGAFPGRMAITTSTVFMLLGTAVFLTRPAERWVVAAQYVSLTAWAICLVTIAGYLFGVHQAGFASRVTMLFQSCVACCLLSSGVLLAYPHRGPIKVLTSRAPGGTMARLLLPAAVVLPAAIGYLQWMGQLAGLYDTAFGLALFASANTVIFVALILGSAAWLDRLDHKRTSAESEQLQSEAQYRTLVESLPQIVWTATASGRCDYLSHRWYEYTGIDEQRSMGLRWTRVVHEDDRELNTRLWMDSVKTGKPFDGEYRVIGKDGNYRWFRAIAIPMRDSAGKVLKWFGTSMDVEDRKRDENSILLLNEHLEERVKERTRELADTEEKLKGVLSAATRAAFISVDTDRRIQMFNTGAEKMLGYTEAEVLGRTPDLYHDAEEIGERVDELSARLGRPATALELFRGGDMDGPGSEGEWAYIRKDGQRIDVIQAITPIRDARGVLKGYLGVSTDITARKSLERELRHKNEKLVSESRRAEEASQAKSDFLATMSHEIRTPMNAILGMADLLAESKLDAEQRTCVEVFQRAGSNLMSLINDILDLSKIEAGRIELEQADFDIREVIAQVVELTGKKAQDRGLVLKTDVAEDLPLAVTGDPMRLRQILINLVGNAIKFTDQGNITIAAAFAHAGLASEITFAVRDTGIGIPESKRNTIFESFTQADSSTTRKYGGTGLGLAISRRLVESMGGRIEVLSELGKGSEFRFTAVFGVSTGPAPRPQVSMEELRGCRVLVIDDDHTNLLVIRHLMTGWGMTVTEFTSPDEALINLREAGAESYSLAIVDGEMPVMDGFEAAAAIGGIAPGLPVLMLSSATRMGDSVRSRREGLAGYAAKPVEKSDLLRMVRQSVRVSPMMKTSEKTGSGLRILAAEDSLDNQMLLKMYLKDEPHELVFVETGAAAVEQRRAQAFDLILMDMQMPVMDGLTATRAIRAMESERGWSPVPIVAFTANASAADIEKSWEAGCNGHLTKPIKRARLLRVLEEYVASDIEVRKPLNEPKRDIQGEFDQMVKDLIPDYMKAVRQEVAGARALLEAGDAQALRRLGHNYKGTSAIYGFPALGKIGGVLEAAAQAGDTAAMATCLADLEREVAAIAPGEESN